MGMVWCRATVVPGAGELGPYESIGKTPSTYARTQTQENAGIVARNLVQRLDASGNPSGSGSIGVLGIGMSNASNMFDVLRQSHLVDAARQPGSVFVNGASPGQTASEWRLSGSSAWTDAATEVTRKGLTAAQIQVGYVMMTQKKPHLNGAMTTAALDEICANFLTKYPNLKFFKLSGLNYTGYSANPETGNTTLAPEPYTWGDSILMGDLCTADHNFGKWADFNDLWADGVNVSPTTGLSYLEEDILPDGVHPSDPIGRTKMANSIITRWKADPVMQGVMYVAP